VRDVDAIAALAAAHDLALIADEPAPNHNRAVTFRAINPP
jgi:hypothetical protein